MAFILQPPPKPREGGFTQFATGVSEGLGDDLPQLLNQFFEQRSLNTLQGDLEDLDEDASVLDTIDLINKAKIPKEKKDLLVQQARQRGLQNILKDISEGKDISDERIINQIGDPQAVSALSNLQKQQREEQKRLGEAQKTEAQFSKEKLASRDKTLKEVKNLLGAETWETMPVQDKLDVIDKADRAYDETGDPLKALNLVLDQYRDVVGEEEKEEKKEEVPPYRTFFERGWDKLISATAGKSGVEAADKGFENTIGGRQASIARGESASEYAKAVALPEDASLLDRTIYGLSSFMGDLVYHGAGATLGGLITGAGASLVGTPAFGVVAAPAGATAGFFSVPSMIDTAQRLYHEHLEEGGKLTFTEFLDNAAEVAQSGIDTGLEGWILGTLSKMAPILRKSPTLRKFFDSTGTKGKIAESLVKGAIETGTLLGSRVVSGQKVSSEDAQDLAVQIFGFNVFSKLSPKLTKILAKKIEKSDVHPADYLENVKTKLESKNQDVNNPAHFTKAVNDISKEYSKAKKVFLEAEKPEVGREQLEKSATEKKELAGRVREEPIEKILEPKKESKKVQDARDLVKETEKEIVQQRKNIDSLERGLEKAKPQQKKIREQGVKLAEQEIGKLQEKLEIQKENVETLKPKKQKQTQEQLSQQIAKHNIKLVEISKDPGGEVSKDWQRMFERDQKYIQELSERTGELPTPEYINDGIKILDNYLNAYKELLKNVENQIKELAGPKTAKLRGAKQKQLFKDLLELQKNIKKNIKINEAKQNLRKRKGYVKELAKGKGDAYLKQLIKNLGTSSKEFQKDFIKARDILTSTEAKVAKLGHEGIQKATSEFIKNPTESAAQKFEQKTGIPAKEAIQAVEEGKKEGKKIAKEIKKGTPWEEVKHFFEKKLSEYKKKNIPQIKRAIIGGLIIGALQESLDDSVGLKPSVSFLSFVLPGFREVRFGAALFFGFGKQIYNRALEEYWKRQIKKAPTVQAKSNIRAHLRSKDWSTGRIKKLRS